MTGKALEMLESIPVRFHDDPDVQAVMYAYGKEAERFAAARDQVTAGLVTPAKADERILPLWEFVLGLPVAPAISLAARQASASAYLVALRQSGTGRWWEEMLQRVAPGATYEELGGGHVEVSLPLAASQAAWGVTVTLIERVTDAHIDLTFVSSTSFRWDLGKLDDDPLA